LNDSFYLESIIIQKANISQINEKRIMFAFSALLINERTKIMKIENWRSCHQNQREASITPVFPKY